jgi:hypothetical protein
MRALQDPARCASPGPSARALCQGWISSSRDLLPRARVASEQQMHACTRH